MTATAVAVAPRRRTVLWVTLGLAVLLGALVVVLAVAGPTGSAPTGTTLIGRAAPALAGTDQAGREVTLASYRGRWVLVNFAASTCIPCQQETPQLETLAAAPSAPAIVTVAYQQSDLGALRGFLASRHADWPVVDAPGAIVGWGIGGLPESYLVDPEGTVVAKVTGGVVASKLEALTGAFPAASS